MVPIIIYNYLLCISQRFCAVIVAINYQRVDGIRVISALEFIEYFIYNPCIFYKYITIFI